MRAFIKAPVVRVYGYYGMMGATVDSVSLTNLKVKMEGDLAGQGGSIFCRSGTQCTLTCESSGCKDLDYLCFNGATCKVTPKECGQPRAPKQVEGINCPNMLISSSEEDRELYDLIEERKVERLRDESYLKMMERFELDIDREEQELNLMDNDIEITEMKGMNNGWNTYSFFSWNMQLFGGGILCIIGMVICYSGYSHFKLRHQELLYYQHLK